MEKLKRTLTVLLLVSFFTSSAQLAFNKSISQVATSDALTINDITAPSTDLLRTDVNDFIYGPATRIKFKIVEEGSGLESTFFKIADLPYMRTDGRQMVPHQLADGEYLLRYYSVDKSGNQEQVRMDKVYIDKTGPMISSEFDNAPISVEEGLPIFTKETKLTISAKDKMVEVQKLTYKINDGAIIESENPETIDLSKAINDVDGTKLKIEIRAYDSFYNLSKEVVEFSIR